MDPVSIMVAVIGVLDSSSKGCKLASQCLQDYKHADKEIDAAWRHASLLQEQINGLDSLIKTIDSRSDNLINESSLEHALPTAQRMLSEIEANFPSCSGARTWREKVKWALSEKKRLEQERIRLLSVESTLNGILSIGQLYVQMRLLSLRGRPRARGNLLITAQSQATHPRRVGAATDDCRKHQTFPRTTLHSHNVREESVGADPSDSPADSTTSETSAVDSTCQYTRVLHTYWATQSRLQQPNLSRKHAGLRSRQDIRSPHARIQSLFLLSFTSCRQRCIRQLGHCSCMQEREDLSSPGPVGKQSGPWERHYSLRMVNASCKCRATLCS